MLLPAVPLRWLHVTITWSAVWGLKYYEDGRLVKEEVNFELTGNSDKFDTIHIGETPSVSLIFYPLTFQMSDLVFWHVFLSEAVVKEEFSLSGTQRSLTKWGYISVVNGFNFFCHRSCHRFDLNTTIVFLTTKTG